MAWEWFSDGRITDEQLSDAITRLKETAWVHEVINFPDDPTPDLLARIKQSIEDGYMKIACNLLADGGVDQTFFFQKSDFLSAELSTIVWSVSYGFDQRLLQDDADQETCRNFIQENMTPTMDSFMADVGVTHLFSIDYGTADANPLGRKIGRLQTLGAGDQWGIAGLPQSFSGTDDVHKYYGKPVAAEWQFRVTTIERLGN